MLILGILAILALGTALVVRQRRSSSKELPWEQRPELEQQALAEAEPDVEAPVAPQVPAEPGPAEPEVPAEPAVPEVEVPAVEVPESVGSRMERLRGRLAASGALGRALLSILSRGDLSEADWEEFEDTLLMADLGLDATTELMDTLRTQTKVRGTTDVEEVRVILREELLALVGPDMDRSLNLEPVVADDARHPASILMVGVNGTGKTTTTGKLARLLVADGKSVVLGAADTFRAAAADQLATWGERVGVDVVRSDREGADPASVAFEAVKVGRESGADVVIVDTAGRLQNKAGLMDELGKIRRVMEKGAPLREVLLVLDATTGQNGMTQAKVFAEVAGITGIVLTKLDGTAKGGIVVSVQRELGVPVKFVGLGEGADDLAPFNPEDFVDSLLA
ncbi:signal recognition particle-docking protein FtsY [Trueperella bernardiae]|uniref:Signal recognition particle receptor FtsY n=1 Tax=Trueperella bernardiae TaxID=59561 RepID=A0AAW6ZM00_9ACTO|nr:MULTISPECIES: signal recognition particle-docking protein FtsY [Trueperella]MCM3907359.1 signal recognition particle-docking protein FtsY [Trueperella bernardiae]MDK8601328.1 signal recognition particle-docking protein FtsY [Trueperella bernardiae]WIM08888.1 signal recognition particle-docking protein FtsY [Trueperella bernardiae]